MAAKKKFLIIGSAAVLAIGGAGLYAGSLTVSTSGGTGSDTVDVSASCAATASVAAQAATWDPGTPAGTNPDYKFDGVTLTLPSGNTCAGQNARIVLYTEANGAVVAETASTQLLTAGGATTPGAAAALSVDIDFSPSTKVSAGINDTTHSWGVVIQG